MIRVLLVEDDALFRYAARSLVDWGELGFHIYDEALNGRQAWDKIRTNRPDVIITDISMPIMSGIELIRLVKEWDASIKVIVMSSYEDFDYVKDALKLGAEDYLLKHDLNVGQLIQLLQSIKDSLSMTSRGGIRIELGEDQRQMLVNSFGNQLLFDDAPDEASYRSTARKLQLELPERQYAVFVIEDGNAEGRRLADSLYGSGSHSQNRLMFQTASGLYVGLLTLPETASRAQTEQHIAELAHSLLREISREGKAVLGIGGVSSKLSDLRKLYDQAKISVKNRWHNGWNEVYDFRAGNGVQSESGCAEDAEWTDTLIEAFKHPDKDKMLQSLNRIFLAQQSCKLSEEETKSFWIECYSLLYVYLKERGLRRIDLIDQKGSIHSMFQQDIRTMKEMCDYCTATLLRLHEELYSLKRGYKREIQKAIEYIEQHYNEEISLADLASQLNLSPNYLSNLFKAETGTRLVEYINHLRIEIAAKLIRTTDMKVYEIAEKVGFKNTSYFCTIFKELTGENITAYKNSNKY